MTESWREKSIVIVDDSAISRAALEELYTSVGLKVIANLASGVEAVKVVPDLVPDYVSLDIIMPEMDGIECFFKLKDLSISANIFLVSALSLENRVVSVYADEIPPESFLPKPLDQDILRNYLEGLSGLKPKPVEIPAEVTSD
jgi:two-component system chemotaxis response regulator CheY